MDRARAPDRGVFGGDRPTEVVLFRTAADNPSGWFAPVNVIPARYVAAAARAAAFGR
ncbi:MAG: hypothetical protein U0531_19545 [Dehalococcoidia bacterium]